MFSLNFSPLLSGSRPQTRAEPLSPVRNPFEDFDSRRFPGAVRAEQPENFAFFHGKTHTAQSCHCAVVLVQVFYRDNRVAHE